MISIDISPDLLHDEVREVSAALPFDKEVWSMKTVWNRFGLLCVILLSPLLLYAVGAWGLMLLPGPVCGPPEDVMLTFDSDQEMADRCGCLTYDMAGLTVDHASRTLRCLSGGEEDPDRWDPAGRRLHVLRRKPASLRPVCPRLFREPHQHRDVSRSEFPSAAPEDRRHPGLLAAAPRTAL